jgi:hypothetical protein
MPRVGFEPTTPMFERAKTVHAFDRDCERRVFNLLALLLQLQSIITAHNR